MDLMTRFCRFSLSENRANACWLWETVTKFLWHPFVIATAWQWLLTSRGCENRTSSPFLLFYPIARNHRDICLVLKPWYLQAVKLSSSWNVPLDRAWSWSMRTYNHLCQSIREEHVMGNINRFVKRTMSVFSFRHDHAAHNTDINGIERNGKKKIWRAWWRWKSKQGHTTVAEYRLRGVCGPRNGNCSSEARIVRLAFVHRYTYERELHKTPRP